MIENLLLAYKVDGLQESSTETSTNSTINPPPPLTQSPSSSLPANATKPCHQTLQRALAFKGASPKARWCAAL